MTSWRILVVDDEPLVLHMLRDVLTRLPADVLEAKEGEEALRLAKAERPDLILLDVMMPRMDGYQVAAALKQDPATATIPIIFISALGSSRDKVRGLDLGAEDYLVKPVDPDELKIRVRGILRRSRPPQREPAMASGQLQAMNLVSLVQLLEGERRTARLLLTRGDEQGEVTFVDGKITRAVQGPRQGKAAVFQLLTWQAGTFQMASPEPSDETGGSVTLPNQVLLMEGVRRLDEIPALRASLPAPGVALGFLESLRAAVEALAQPEAAALVALLDGARDLEQVVVGSPFDAWTTLKILQYLLGVRALTSADVSPERRGGARLNVDVPVEYQRVPGFLKRTSFNLSARGVFIQTAVPFEVGEQVILRFQVPGHEAPVKVTGQVVWRNADPGKHGGTGMGIQFLDLAPADREAIERHLAQAIAVQISGAGERA
ncbi:MAG: TIGR02266 family protein [candidate division NC10 bacterium]|nr:TIGR02266 family protein [candidate division NC10 bacterium]